MSFLMVLRAALAALSVWLFSVIFWQSTEPEVPADPFQTTLPATLSAPDPTGLPDMALARPASLKARAAPSPMPEMPLATNGFGEPCGLQMQAEAAPGAFLHLEIHAPCRPETAMILRHAGMQVSVTTDIMGQAALVLPALAHPAEVTLDPGHGAAIALALDVPDLAEYHRLALAWTGAAGPELIAEEGLQPAITPARPGSANALLNGQSGHLLAVGHAPHQAQVYTIARDALFAPAAIRISVRTPCDAALAGETFDSTGDGPPAHIRMTLAPTGCDGLAQDRVLQNLFRDLRLAEN